MINTDISAKLNEQAEKLKEQLSWPLSEKYKEQLRMYHEGSLQIIGDNVEEYINEMQKNATDHSRDTLFADFIKNTVVDEAVTIAALKNELRKLFDEVINDDGFQTAGAMMIVYDWYYHYDSGATLMRKDFVYPVLYEPRYLERVAPSLYLKSYEGPRFINVWPDCSEVEDEDEDMGSMLMNYYQYCSRSMLHRALAEMDQQGELEFLINRPFIFYIGEHDCELMTLFVKE